MNKLKAFFYVFKNSALKPAYYQDVLKAPFSFSLKYFFALFLALSLFQVVALGFLFQQKALPYLQNLKTRLPGFYPNELEIKIKNGQVVVNVDQPFFVPLKPDLFPDNLAKALSNQPIQNILVINTQANPMDINKYQTLALLTKDSLVLKQNRNEIKIQSLKEIKDFTLNKTILNRWWQQIIPYFRFLLPLIVLFLFLIVPSATLTSKLFYLGAISLISWLIAKLVFKLKKINYQKALQINLQAVTLPTVVLILFQSLGLAHRPPFFFTIILFIFNLIIFSSLKK